MGRMRLELAANLKEVDPRKILGPAREETIAVIQEKMRIFGSSGKA